MNTSFVSPPDQSIELPLIKNRSQSIQVQQILQSIHKSSRSRGQSIQDPDTYTHRQQANTALVKLKHRVFSSSHAQSDIEVKDVYINSKELDGIIRQHETMNRILNKRYNKIHSNGQLPVKSESGGQEKQQLKYQNNDRDFLDRYHQFNQLKYHVNKLQKSEDLKEDRYWFGYPKKDQQQQQIYELQSNSNIHISNVGSSVNESGVYNNSNNNNNKISLVPARSSLVHESIKNRIINNNAELENVNSNIVKSKVPYNQLFQFSQRFKEIQQNLMRGPQQEQLIVQEKKENEGIIQKKDGRRSEIKKVIVV